jgi:hypothetical protein
MPLALTVSYQLSKWIEKAVNKKMYINSTVLIKKAITFAP